MSIAIPYVIVLLAMAFLIRLFVKSCPQIGIKKLYARGFEQLSYRYILIMFAYIIYIIFAVFKKISINIGAADAYHYREYFYQIPSSLIYYLKSVTTFEPGYSFVTWIFRQLTGNYKIMLLFWHSLTFVLIITFLRKIYNKKHSYVAIFLILQVLISQFNTLRMSISICLALVGLIYLSKENFIKSMVLFILAMSMQVSAVIMVPVWIVYFLITKRHSYPVRQLIVYTVLGFIATVGLLGAVTVVLAGSSKSVYLGESSLALGTYLAVFVIFCLSIYKYKEMLELNYFNKVLIFMLPICFICIPLQYKVAIMYRLTLYFIPVMLGLIPSIIKCYSSNKLSSVGIAVKVLLYAYMFLRAYAFFTEEIVYIGPYISTLF